MIFEEGPTDLEKAFWDFQTREKRLKKDSIDCHHHSIANKRIEKASRKLHILKHALCDKEKHSDIAMSFKVHESYVSQLRKRFHTDENYVEKIMLKIKDIQSL